MAFVAVTRLARNNDHIAIVSDNGQRNNIQ